MTSHHPGITWRVRFAGWIVLCLLAMPAMAQELPLPTERELKVAFLYNFMLFTEWPADVGSRLNLCILGPDPFGEAIDALHGKRVDERHIVVQRKGRRDSLLGCELIVMTEHVSRGLVRVCDELRNLQVLTVVDSPAPGNQNCALNMSVVDHKVTFGVNLRAVPTGRIKLSSKMLRLASEVIQ